MQTAADFWEALVRKYPNLSSDTATVTISGAQMRRLVDQAFLKGHQAAVGESAAVNELFGKLFGGRP